MSPKIINLNHLKYKVCKFFETDWQVIQEAYCSSLPEDIQNTFLTHMNNTSEHSNEETVQFLIEIWEPSFFFTYYYLLIYRKDTNFYSLEELLKNHDKLICATN